jgi:hypothetical protein
MALTLYVFWAVLATITAKFALDDTEGLKQRYPDIIGMPSLFGYTKKEGDKIWPRYLYPECEESLEAMGRSLYIDYDTNLLHLN